MENEFGEEIPEEKIKKIARRIAKLPKEKIDLLFHKVGFIVHENEGKKGENKALLPGKSNKLKKIKKIVG